MRITLDLDFETICKVVVGKTLVLKCVFEELDKEGEIKGVCPQEFCGKDGVWVSYSNTGEFFTRKEFIALVKGKHVSPLWINTYHMI